MRFRPQVEMLEERDCPSSQMFGSVCINYQPAPMLPGAALTAHQLNATAIDTSTGQAVAGTWLYTAPGTDSRFYCGTVVSQLPLTLQANFYPGGTDPNTDGANGIAALWTDETILLQVPANAVWVLSTANQANTALMDQLRTTAIDTGNAGVLTLQNGQQLFGDNYNLVGGGATIKTVLYQVQNDQTGSKIDLSTLTYQTTITATLVLNDGSTAVVSFDLYW